MPEPKVSGRRWVAGVVLALALVTMLVAGARAEPTQLVKTFNARVPSPGSLVLLGLGLVLLALLPAVIPRSRRR